MPITRRHGWRRFRPVTLTTPRASLRSQLKAADSVVARAEVVAEQAAQKNPVLERAVDLLRSQLMIAPTPERTVALALLLTPQASRAQFMMDAHKHTFYNRKERLLELIDFNDAFVSAIIACSDQLEKFSDQFRDAQKRFCKRHKTPVFTDGQWHAIEHGLSREAAVYFAAQHAGFDVVMTSRTDDAFGIDMQVRDRAQHAYVNIDCKTHSSFFFRLKQLVREKRLSERDALRAQELGFCATENCRDNHCVRVVLVRIDHTILGDIVAFRFVDDTKIVAELRKILRVYGMHDAGFGRDIAPL